MVADDVDGFEPLAGAEVHLCRRLRLVDVARPVGLLRDEHLLIARVARRVHELLHKHVTHTAVTRHTGVSGTLRAESTGTQHKSMRQLIR